MINKPPLAPRRSHWRQYRRFRVHGSQQGGCTEPSWCYRWPDSAGTQARADPLLCAADPAPNDSNTQPTTAPPRPSAPAPAPPPVQWTFPSRRRQLLAGLAGVGIGGCAALAAPGSGSSCMLRPACMGFKGFKRTDRQENRLHVPPCCSARKQLSGHHQPLAVAGRRPASGAAADRHICPRQWLQALRGLPERIRWVGVAGAVCIAHGHPVCCGDASCATQSRRRE